MNRKERRKLARDIQKTQKFGRVTFKSALEYANKLGQNNSFKEGDKVKINYEFIKRQKPEEVLKTFIEENKDRIFTVEKVHDNHTLFINLEEDNNSPKINFKSTYLTPIATATVTLEDGSKTQVDLGDIKDVNDERIMKLVNKELENEN